MADHPVVRKRLAERAALWRRVAASGGTGPPDDSVLAPPRPLDPGAAAA